MAGLLAAAANLNGSARADAVQAWWRQEAVRPDGALIACLEAAPFDVATDALSLLETGLPAARSRPLLGWALGQARSPLWRQIATHALIRLRYRSPVDVELEASLRGHPDPQVRLDWLTHEHQPPRLDAGVGAWLADPDPRVRGVAARLMLAGAGLDPPLPPSLAREEDPFVAYQALAGLLAGRRPAEAWRLWAALPRAARCRASLNVLRRHAGPEPQPGCHELGVQAPAIEAGLAYLGALERLRQPSGTAPPTGAGGLVAGLLAARGPTARAMAGHLFARMMTSGDERAIEAAVAGAAGRPRWALAQLETLLMTSDARVLTGIARNLPQLATRPEAYPLARYLARHRFESVAAAAVGHLGGVIEAQPQHREDWAALLRARSQRVGCCAAPVAVEALLGLAEVFVDLAGVAESSLIGLADHGALYHQLEAIARLGRAPASAARDRALARAGRRKAAALREAALAAQREALDRRLAAEPR